MSGMPEWMYWPLPKSMFEGEKQETPQMPATPDAGVAAGKARAAEKNKRRAMAGSETVNTNPLGVAGQAAVARKKLLGE